MLVSKGSYGQLFPSVIIESTLTESSTSPIVFFNVVIFLPLKAVSFSRGGLLESNECFNPNFNNPLLI